MPLTHEELARKNGWTPLQEAVQSLHSAICFSSEDWSCDHRHAWIYGIIVGWDAEPEEPDEKSALEEVAEKFKWDAETVSRMERYRRILNAPTSEELK